MLYLICALAAHAANVTRTVVFPINQTAPSASIPSSQSIEWEVVYGLDSDHEIPDMTIQSSWSPLTCVVYDGVVAARFKSTRGTWPSSWPGSATCSATVGGSSTLTVTLTIQNCTGSECDRKDFDGSAAIPSCSSPWTISGKGYSVNTCTLPNPPSGKQYAVPKWASASKGNGLDSWPAHYKLGASADPDTDPKVGGVECRMGLYTSPNPDVYLFQVVVSENLSGDLSSIYCPTRLMTTATKAFSWANEISVVVDRP